jgi:catechol 2,3-dioxygenase-like lactoylglutathione lyase family enzyme
MFSHVMVGSDDLDRSKAFYDAVLGVIGVKPGVRDGDRIFWFSPPTMFSVSRPINGEPTTYANGGTIGFACDSPEQVKAFHDAAVANGGVSCEDPPGVRERPTLQLYLAYVRDPFGNKLCALHRMPAKAAAQ